MKRSLNGFFAATVLLLCSCINISGTPAGRTTESKSVKIGTDYKSLKVSSAIDVVYSPTATQMTIETPDDFLQYFRYDENGGKLSLWIDKMPRKTVIEAYCHVTLPVSSRLSSITLNGASDFETAVPLNAESFDLTLSGACDFESTAGISAESLDIYLSGASNLSAECNARTMRLKLSGASDADICGNTEELSLVVSGASELDDLNDRMLDAAAIDATVSGASSAELHSNGTASGSVSGASSMTIHGSCKSSIKTSGGSSLHTR